MSYFKLSLSNKDISDGHQLTIDADPTVSASLGDTTYQAGDIGTVSGKIAFRRDLSFFKFYPHVALGLAIRLWHGGPADRRALRRISGGYEVASVAGVSPARSS